MRFWMIAVVVILIGAAGGAYLASRSTTTPAAALAITPVAGPAGAGAPGAANGQRSAGGFSGQRGPGGATPNGTPTGNPGARSAGAGAAARGIDGSVASTGEDSLQVETQQGVTTVKFTPDTRIQRVTSATAADIRPGDRVIVAGERITDGTLIATSIQIVPAQE